VAKVGRRRWRGSGLHGDGWREGGSFDAGNGREERGDESLLFWSTCDFRGRIRGRRRRLTSLAMVIYPAG
jgi:hypothetical protein